MKNYSTLDLERLSKVFTTLPLSNEWWFVLSVGTTKFYSDNTVLLTYYVDTETQTLVINSMSRSDKDFPKSVLHDIRELIISWDKVIIASSVEKISKHMLLKYGFKYFKDKQLYIKGDLQWVLEQLH